FAGAKGEMAVRATALHGHRGAILLAIEDDGFVEYPAAQQLFADLMAESCDVPTVLGREAARGEGIHLGRSFQCGGVISLPATFLFQRLTPPPLRPRIFSNAVRLGVQ